MVSVFWETWLVRGRRFQNKVSGLPQTLSGGKLTENIEQESKLQRQQRFRFFLLKEEIKSWEMSLIIVALKSMKRTE